MDVICAYLAGLLNEVIYMDPPEGYDRKVKVCRLMKSSYGLKQSVRVWNHQLWNFLVQHGFKQLLSDYGLYSNGTIIVAVYIDDFAIAEPWDLQVIREVKELLQKEFEMK